MKPLSPPLPFWRALWFKLAAAFFLVSLVAVAVVALWVNQATTASFARFLDADQSIQLERVQEGLEALYAVEGSWANADVLLRTYRTGMGAGGSWRLIDAQGETVSIIGGGGQRGQMRGQGPPQQGTSLPLAVDGQVVGRLEVVMPGGGPAGSAMMPHVAQFLVGTEQAIWFAVLVAALLSVVLGIGLARLLTRPVAQLTEATRLLAGGEPSPPVAVHTDDELGRLTAAFNSMAAELARAEQQRQQLLADTAHELRTPLTVMQGHLEAMLDEVFPPTLENLAAVHEETLLLKRLVGDLRLLSLADMGELPLEKERVDLAEVIERAVAPFAPLAEAGGVRLTLEIEERPLPLLADAGRLQQVVANLLSNALRHLPSSGGRLAVSAGRVSGGLRVAVGDNGPGLTAEEQARVFARFWKADHSRSRTGGGSGLGLAISRAIVEAHGGRIGVESRPEQGATFSFWLPGG